MASLHKFLLSFLPLISCLSSMTRAEPKSKAYIIHMDKAAMPKPFSTHQSWFHSTLASVSETPSIASKLIHTYTNSMHGFSATLTPSELETLKSLPGYLHSTPDRRMSLHTTHTTTFLGLDPCSGIWPASSFGAGVVIGVIDSGVWPESASFHDGGMLDPPTKWRGTCEAGHGFSPSLCNKKLIGARFFNKGLRADDPQAHIVENSTRDEIGHGTHTASTAAGARVDGASYFGYGTGTAVGVATGAHLAAYKCAWLNGFSTLDFLAAADQAIDDGVDVMSLSLGIGFDIDSLEDDMVAVATFAAAEKGIFVSASAGNDGPHPGTVINGAPWMTTVAAGTVDRSFGGSLILENGVEIGFESLYPGNWSSGLSHLRFLDGCRNLETVKKLEGTIIVCNERNSNLGDQVESSRSLKSTGAIFITNKANLDNYYTKSSIPAAFIGLKDGQTLMNYINTTPNPRAKFEFKKTVIGGISAPKVDRYSSRGPFLSCPGILKPDILAPGTSILAAWPPKIIVTEVGFRSQFSDFNIETGTSMSAPHVAGAAALVMSSHPDWSPAAVRSALITTAKSLDNKGNPIGDVAGYGIPGLDGGAGHLDPNKAADPGLVYDLTTEDYVSFLCGLNYTAKQIRIITKASYACANHSNSDLNYPSFVAYFNSTDDESIPGNGGRVFKEFRRTVTNVGEERSSYTARLTAMSEIRATVQPEKLVFEKKYEKLSYKLILEGPKVLKARSVLGSLSWVEQNGKYAVRSPIVATSIDPKTLH